MKRFGGRLDFSCVTTDRVFEASATDKEALELLPRSIETFTDMVATKMVSDDDEAWNECLGIGLSTRERHHYFLQHAARYLQTAPSIDSNEVTAFVKRKLREHAVSAWIASHHRN